MPVAIEVETQEIVLEIDKGKDGRDGADGTSATVEVGSVATVNPGEPATVTNTGDESAAVLNFEIPRGTDGASGVPGTAEELSASATGHVYLTGSDAQAQLDTADAALVGFGTAADNLSTSVADLSTRTAVTKSFRTPVNGLSNWRTSTRALRHIVLLGDSIVQGDVGTPTPRGFGPCLRSSLADEIKVTVHCGVQGIWRTAADHDGGIWSFAGTWTSTPNATNVSPMLDSLTRSSATGTGSSAIATWTKAAGATVTDLWINYSDVSTIAGSANPSYSVDGGTTWIDLPLTRPITPTFKRVHVTGLSNPATVKVRGANSAGVSSTAHLSSIEVASGSSGVVVHNWGRASSSMGAYFGGPFGPRDYQAWWNAVQPELVIYMESNSSQNAPGSFNNIPIDNFLTLVKSWGGQLLMIGMPPQDPAQRTEVNQALWRSLYRTSAVAADQGFLDMTERWGLYASALASGYMSTDGLHPTTAGGANMAQAVLNYLRAA